MWHLYYSIACRKTSSTRCKVDLVFSCCRRWSLGMSTGLADLLSAPVEILTLTINECFIYKVPPLRSASGHRAEDWKLENPLFTGCLKVFQADTKVMGWLLLWMIVFILVHSWKFLFMLSRILRICLLRLKISPCLVNVLLVRAFICFIKLLM